MSIQHLFALAAAIAAANQPANVQPADADQPDQPETAETIAAAIVTAESTAVAIAAVKKAATAYKASASPYVALCRHVYRLMQAQGDVVALRKEITARVKHGLIRDIEDAATAETAVAATLKRVSRAFTAAEERLTGKARLGRGEEPVHVPGLAVESADHITSADTEADRRARAAFAARAAERKERGRVEAEAADAAIRRVINAAAELRAALDRGMRSKAEAMLVSLLASIDQLPVADSGPKAEPAPKTRPRTKRGK